MRALALRGLQDAAGQVSAADGQEYVALGTAVFWAANLDEQLRREHGKPYDALRETHPGGAVLPGIRLVRNGIIQGAVIAATPSGLQWPLQRPLDWGDFVYQPLEHLLGDWIGERQDRKANAQQDAIYRERFEGRTLAEPLWEAIA